jgi:hypothetical protein
MDTAANNNNQHQPEQQQDDGTTTTIATADLCRVIQTNMQQLGECLLC